MHEAAIAIESIVILVMLGMVLWERFDQFTPGTNFQAWARQIALNRVRNFRRTIQARIQRSERD